MAVRCVLFILCAVWSAGNVTGTEPTLLRVQPRKGMSYAFDVVNSSTQVMTLMGREIANDITSKARVSVVVSDATLDRSTLTCSVSHARTSLSSRGANEVALDKDTTFEFPQFDGSAIVAVISKTGSVLSTTFDQATPAGVFAASLRFFDRIFPDLPQNELSVGDSWTSSRRDSALAGNNSGLIISNIRLKHTFRGVKDTLGVACWFIETVATAFDQEGSLTMNDMAMTLDGQGTLIQRTFLERGTGMAVLSSGDVTTQLQMSITGQQAVVVPVDTHLSFTIRRKGTE